VPRAALGSLLLLAGCSAPFRTTVTLTAPEIEQSIAGRFPIEKRALVAAVELDRPRVLFEESSDRIGLEMDAMASVLGQEHAGTATVFGRLRYEGATGEIYLDEPEVVRLELPHLPEEQRAPVRAIVNAVAAAVLSQVPIYRLEDRSETAFIKSM
jgi:hypothetical protein